MTNQNFNKLLMTNTNAKNKIIAKNTFFLYFRMALVLLISLYTTRVVLRTLGVVDYGINNVVCGFVSMFSFMNTSISIGIQRFINFAKGKKDVEEQKHVFAISFIIQVLLSVFVLVVLETFGVWYINNQLVIPEERLFAAHCIFQLSTFSLLLVMIQAPYCACILAYERMDYYAIVSIIDVTLKLIAVILLPYIDFDKLILYGILLFCISLLNLFLYYGYCQIKISISRFKWYFNVQLFKNILSFTGWNLFEMFAYMMKGQGLNMLLNSFFGPIVNAARGVANMIYNAIQGFNSNMVVAFRPQLVESYAQDEYERVAKLMFSLSKLTYVLLFSLSLPLMLELPFVLDLWLGDGYPNYTEGFTILVLIDMIICSLNTPLSQVVQATGIIKTYQIVRSIVVLSLLPISWIYLYFGYPAYTVFYINIVVSIVNHPISMVLLRRVFPYSYWEYCKKTILPCILYTLLLPLVPFSAHHLIMNSVLRFTVVLLLSILMSLLIFYYIIMDKNEKAVFKKMIIRK